MLYKSLYIIITYKLYIYIYNKVFFFKTIIFRSSFYATLYFLICTILIHGVETRMVNCKKALLKISRA